MDHLPGPQSWQPGTVCTRCANANLGPNFKLIINDHAVGRNRVYTGVSATPSSGRKDTGDFSGGI